MWKKIKYVLNQAWICFALMAWLIAVFADIPQAFFTRLSMLQIHAQYPIEYLYDNKAYNVESFRQSIRYYQVLVKRFPSLIDAHVVLGMCYAEIGKDQKAQQYFHHAFELNKNFVWNRYNLGILDYREGKFSQAEEIFRKISALGPDSLNIFPFDKGVLYKFDSGIREKIINQSIEFNKILNYEAKSMILQCLWAQEKYEMVFKHANIFLSKTGRKQEQLVFSLWAARALLQISSDEHALYYLAKINQQHSQIKNFLDFVNVFNSHAKSKDALDSYLQDLLPDFNRFIIHPWRNVILIGREMMYSLSINKT